MSDWHEYVRRWSALPADHQRTEWEKLTEEQRKAFEAARLEIVAASATPQATAGARKRPLLPWLIGCGCLGIIGFLAFVAFVVKGAGGLAELEKRGAELREAEEQQAAQSEASSTPSIAAPLLVAEYDRNEVAADQKYKGRRLIVEGVVEDVGKDILDDMYVTLAASDSTFRSVQCYFSTRHENVLASLQPGQYVRLIGRCDGVFGNVHLKDCKLVE